MGLVISSGKAIGIKIAENTGSIWPKTLYRMDSQKEKKLPGFLNQLIQRKKILKRIMITQYSSRVESLLREFSNCSKLELLCRFQKLPRLIKRNMTKLNGNKRSLKILSLCLQIEGMINRTTLM
jgi:hypothetical protein